MEEATLSEVVAVGISLPVEGLRCLAGYYLNSCCLEPVRGRGEKQCRLAEGHI